MRLGAEARRIHVLVLCVYVGACTYANSRQHNPVISGYDNARLVQACRVPVQLPASIAATRATAQACRLTAAMQPPAGRVERIVTHRAHVRAIRAGESSP